MIGRALRGFWSFLVGGAALVVLLVALHPVTDRRDCPNYGGNGNASVFADPAWDVRLPLLLFGWIVLIGIEQTLPVTTRDVSRPEIAVRAIAAPVLAVVVSCCVFGNLMIMCH